MVVRAVDGSFERLAAAVLAAFLLMGARHAGAESVTRDCPRLSEARWQELEARLRVLLGVHARAQLAVEVRCDATSAEVVLTERARVTRLPLRPDEDLIEGTLAAVEVELAKAPEQEPPPHPTTAASNQAPPPPLEDAASPVATPPSAPPAQPLPPVTAPALEPASRGKPSPKRPAATLSGGIGLAVAAETWSGARPALGPRLHLALGREELCVVAVESLGFGRLERHAALTFGTELGVAWGAPYASGRRLGAQVLLGHEWLSSSANDAATSQTSGVWSVALGARAALPIEPVSLFVGPDLRVRLGESELGPPLSIGLPSYSLLVQAGVFWIEEAMPRR